MSVNEFKATSNYDDKENSQTSLIVLHKKNIKLISHMNKSAGSLYEQVIRNI